MSNNEMPVKVMLQHSHKPFGQSDNIINNGAAHRIAEFPAWHKEPERKRNRKALDLVVVVLRCYLVLILLETTM
jgi:hypothetical protein